MNPSHAGMEDVVAAQSSITSLDGNAGWLRYRGYDIGDLARNVTFEEVAYLLWYGDLPTNSQRDELRSRLRQVRMEHAGVLDLVVRAPTSAHPLDVLRHAVCADALTNPLVADNSAEANLAKAIAFTAWFPIVVAGFQRHSRGQAPVPPQSDGDTAANYVRMLTGSEPPRVAAQTLDMSMVLHADHELNASTFAARVTIATQSNLHAAVASALGCLSGPRHGGASDRVISMLEQIGDASRAEEYVRDELAAHRRIMGFGHRVYRTSDPRSVHLRSMASELVAGTGREEWMRILAALSSIMEREKGLYPNVDLYAAVVNYELGIDPRFYTSIFAVSRIVGWTAHAMEQLGGRMIRPVAEYIGPEPRSIMAGVRG